MSSVNNSDQLGFMLPAAQNNKLRIRGLSKKAIKLNLNSVNNGDVHMISGFLQLFCDISNEQTKNNEKITITFAI